MPEGYTLVCMVHGGKMIALTGHGKESFVVKKFIGQGSVHSQASVMVMTIYQRGWSSNHASQAIR